MIGVLGGGQLGQMLGLAGIPLGERFRFLDPAGDPPASAVGEHVRGAFDDPVALDRLAAGARVVTYEFERVPAASARRIAATVPVRPGPAALEAAQDRLSEKRLFESVGLPVHAYRPVDTREDLARAADELGLPLVVKVRHGGYDGKGQALVRDPDGIEAAWAALGGRPLLAEALVAFDREVSIVAVRDPGGVTAAYPLVENRHRDGVLDLTLAPAPGAPPALQAEAERHAAAVMDALDYVGVLCIELFEAGGRLLGNELAPRVHNSGHWTIEGARTSQFENHLRAIGGLPLGPTDAIGHAAMVNLVGDEPDRAALLAVPGAAVHLYGKASRPGRKLGHVTLVDEDPERLAARLAAVRALVPGRPDPGVGAFAGSVG